MKNYLLIIIVCCTGCLSNGSFGETDKQKVTTEVHKTLTDYFTAIKNEGLLSEFKYLDSSQDFFWVPPGFNVPLNYKETRMIIEKSAPLMKNMDNQWKSLQIHPLSNTLAAYTGVVKATYQDTANETQNIELIETGTVIKRSDGWKLLCGQTAAIPVDVAP